MRGECVPCLVWALHAMPIQDMKEPLGVRGLIRRCRDVRFARLYERCPKNPPTSHASALAMSLHNPQTPSQTTLSSSLNVTITPPPLPPPPRGRGKSSRHTPHSNALPQSESVTDPPTYLPVLPLPEDSSSTRDH